MKNFYAVAQVNQNGKYYAYMLKLSESDNLASKLKIKNLYAANLFETKKKAETAVKIYNDQFKANGEYLFDEIEF